jgi:sorbitol/mannitol transport system substrate-binding protein
MNRGRFLALAMGFLMVATLMTFAAGGREAAPAAVATQSVIAAPAAPTTVNLIGWAFPITEFYQSQFRALNSINNLTVNTQLLDSAGAQEQVRLALSAGQRSPYQIVHAANAQISEWGYSGWLSPIDDLVKKYWDKYDLGDIPQTAWDAATVNGKIMGVPVVANTFLMIYREDLFKKHGIAVPKSYDDVLAAVAKLRNEPTIDIPFVINLHAGWAWEIEFFQFLRGFGGDFLNADNTPAFNSPAGVKALEKLLQVANQGVGKEGLAYSVDNLEVGLQTGRVAFANTWASRAVKMNNPEFSDFVKELKFAPSPVLMSGGKAGASAFNDFYCIPAKSEVDRELVFQVIMEATKLESQMEALKHGVPTRAKALASQDAAVYMPAAMQSLRDGIGGYPNNPGVPIVRRVLAQVLPTAITGTETPKQVLDKAAALYTEAAKAQGGILK